MKIMILGAGGITTPLVVKSLLSHINFNIEEVVLFDTDSERLNISKVLITRLSGVETKFTFIQDLRRYKGVVDIAIFSIRPGLEVGRAMDEKICKELGLLANETIGAAGFSFACRTVPKILEQAKILTDTNPNIFFINFTNPAGIVTQALHEAGYKSVVGVCSSADRIKRRVADYLNLPVEQVQSNVFGLNHLSWTTEININEQSVLEHLIKEDDFLQLAQPWFPKEFIRRKNQFLNEYLYFYYFYAEAIKKQEQRRLTRGEELEIMNSNLRKNLVTLLNQSKLAEAQEIYMQYLAERKGTYMKELVEKKIKMKQDRVDEGYSGVAIGVINGIILKQNIRLSICTQIGIAYGGLHATDVVEITCEIRNGSISPIPPVELSSEDHAMLIQVKEFENKTIEAIQRRSKEVAIGALNAHPLLKNPERNDEFVSKIFSAHNLVFQDWRM